MSLVQCTSQTVKSAINFFKKFLNIYKIIFLPFLEELFQYLYYPKINLSLLKLFNGSKEIKTVTVGNKTYTLEPMKTYFLMGDNQKSSLIAGLYFGEEDLAELKGDFGIKILKA